MTSQPLASGDDRAAGTPPAICKRPGCGRPLPARGRGRTRQFCTDDCARRYHNDARLPATAPAITGIGGDDPLASLEALTRQAAACVRAAREQAASLDPARVRAQIAEAEAARRRAEAATVTADARAAEAEAETQALTEALTAAEAAAREQANAARAAQTQLQQVRHDAREQIAAAQATAREQVTATRGDAARAARERDDALAAAHDAQHNADTEISRARQAEADARAETAHVRDDAARERDTLQAHHQAQLDAAHALTDAERARAERAEAQLDGERADRRHLTSKLTSPAPDLAAGNGQTAQGKTTRPGHPRP